MPDYDGDIFDGMIMTEWFWRIDYDGMNMTEILTVLDGMILTDLLDGFSDNFLRRQKKKFVYFVCIFCSLTIKKI
jgi:hypothetical protein